MQIVYIKPFNGIRFIAMLVVFLTHLSFMKIVPECDEFFENYLHFGAIGVTTFVILSGFLMSYLHIGKFESLDFSKAKKFVLNRVIRIYPVYILTVIIMIPVSIIAFKGKFIAFFVALFSNVFLIQDLFPLKAIYLSFNSATWTLSCLFILWVCTPFFLFLINKAKLNKTKILLAICGIYVLGIGLVSLFYNESGIGIWYFYASPFFRVIDYTIGMLLGAFVAKYSTERKINSCVYELIEILSLALFIFAYCLRHVICKGFLQDIWWLPFAAILIFTLSYQKGIISKILSINLFEYLGKISFSFYLIHYPIIRYTMIITDKFLKVQHTVTTVVIQSVFMFIFSMLCAALLYKYIEIPLAKTIKSKISI